MNDDSNWPTGTPRPNPLLVETKTERVDRPGVLRVGGWEVSWSVHALLATSREATAVLTEGAPVTLWLSRSFRDGAARGFDRWVLRSRKSSRQVLHVHLEHPEISLRACGVVGSRDEHRLHDLPMEPEEDNFSEVSGSDLLDLVRTAGGFGARLRPRQQTSGPTAPGSGEMGRWAAQQLEEAVSRLDDDASDELAFRKCEALYVENRLWRPLCRLHDRYPFDQPGRLLKLLDIMATGAVRCPAERSEIALQMGRIFEACDRPTKAAAAYTLAFKCWPMNVEALEARTDLAFSQGSQDAWGFRRVLPELLGFVEPATTGFVRLAGFAWDAGDLDLARSHLDSAASLTPGDERVAAWTTVLARDRGDRGATKKSELFRRPRTDGAGRPGYPIFEARLPVLRAELVKGWRHRLDLSDIGGAEDFEVHVPAGSKHGQLVIIPAVPTSSGLADMRVKIEPRYVRGSTIALTLLGAAFVGFGGWWELPRLQWGGATALLVALYDGVSGRTAGLGRDDIVDAVRVRGFDVAVIVGAGLLGFLLTMI